MIRGLTAGFNTATRALQSSQWAMSLYTQNIANANDPTYTRRTLENPVDSTGRLPYVSRVRDMFVDEQYRAATANAGEAETRRELLNRVEDIFGDPIEGALGLSIDELFDKLKAVSEDPADEVLRQEAIAAGQQFAQHVHEAVSGLNTIHSQINEEIRSTVEQANVYIQNIQDLNSRIAALKNSAESDAELQDQRDKALDQLARLTGAVSTQLADGTVRVMIGSVPAVDGLAMRQIALDETPDGPTPRWDDTTIPTYAGHGVLAALTSMRDTDVNDVMTTLDTLAKNVAKAINTQHKLGFDSNGNPGQDFFLIQDAVPGGIYVDPNLTPETLAAAGSTPVLQADGTNAFAMYRLGEGLSNYPATTTPDPSTAPKTLYRNLVGLVGSKGKAAQQDEEVAKAHTKVSEEQRSSMWGVSIDEETALLTAQSKAYAAVARVMGVMDEMLDVLINATN